MLQCLLGDQGETVVPDENAHWFEEVCGSESSCGYCSGAETLLGSCGNLN